MSAQNKNYSKGQILSRLILSVSELVVTLEKPGQIRQYFNEEEETDFFKVLNINLLSQRHEKCTEIGQLCRIVIDLANYSDSLVLNRLIRPIDIHASHLNQNCVSVNTLDELIEICNDVYINEKLREIKEMKPATKETILLKMQQMRMLQSETGCVMLIFTNNSQTEIIIRK